MVAYLLGIHQAPVDDSLVGLAQDRVERLLRVQVEQGAREPEDHGPFHPFDGISRLTRFLQEIRRQPEPHTQSAQI